MKEHGGGDERWKVQRLAQKLDGEIQQLKVALSELDTVKPKKTTYTKRANVFFLDTCRDAIVKTKKSELKEKETKRLELRNSVGNIIIRRPGFVPLPYRCSLVGN